MIRLAYQQNIRQRLALRPRLNGRWFIAGGDDEIQRVRGAIWVSTTEDNPVATFDSGSAGSLAIQVDGPTGVILLDGAKLLWDALTPGTYVMQIKVETVNEKVWYSPAMLLDVSKSLVTVSVAP